MIPVPAYTIREIPEAFADPKLERKQTSKRTVQAFLRDCMPTGTKAEINRKLKLADSLLSIRFTFQYRASDGTEHEGTSRFRDYPINWVSLDLATKIHWWHKTILAHHAMPADAVLLGVQIHSSSC